jgi:hypothetical protein
MRCHLAAGSEACQRCHRRRTDCVFEEPKKRGRKSQVYVLYCNLASFQYSLVFH